MFIKIENLNIHYKVAGQGEPLLLIHGWGCSGEHLAKLQGHLVKRFTIYSIDLPGFGLSNPPETIWGSTEYAQVIAKFINTVGINRPILIGHSLGGKIIINLVANLGVEVKKIILISSAGIRLPKPLKIKLKIWLFKCLKFFSQFPGIKSIFGAHIENYKRKFGSEDYRW